jgi:hypothetical protein
MLASLLPLSGTDTVTGSNALACAHSKLLLRLRRRCALCHGRARSFGSYREGAFVVDALPEFCGGGGVFCPVGTVVLTPDCGLPAVGGIAGTADGWAMLLEAGTGC